MVIENYVQFMQQSRSMFEKINNDDAFDRPASMKYLHDVHKFILEIYGDSALNECRNDLDLKFEMYSSPFPRLMMNRINRLMQKVNNFKNELPNNS